MPGTAQQGEQRPLVGSTVCARRGLTRSDIRSWGHRYVPTGFQSKELIVKAGLNLGDVDQFPTIDVTIDGADEVDVS